MDYRWLEYRKHELAIDSFWQGRVTFDAPQCNRWRFLPQQRRVPGQATRALNQGLTQGRFSALIEAESGSQCYAKTGQVSPVTGSFTLDDATTLNEHQLEIDRCPAGAFLAPPSVYPVVGHGERIG
jgi:hypothetical protein